MQRTIDLSQQLLKFQLSFSRNFQTRLLFDFSLLFRIVLICFLDASMTFFDIQQRTVEQCSFFRKLKCLKSISDFFSCYSESWYLLLVNFYLKISSKFTGKHHTEVWPMQSCMQELSGRLFLVGWGLILVAYIIKCISSNIS